jgi:hypothetical protein
MPNANLRDPEQLADVLKLPEDRIGGYVTYAGAGGFSSAYFVHPEVPAEVIAKWSDEAFFLGDPSLVDSLRSEWAAEHATEVVKVRKRGKRNAEAMASAILRDIAVEEIAVRLTETATLKGEPLVRVARWRSSQDEILKGVIRQEVVRGPRVYELEAAAHAILTRKARTNTGTGRELESARQLLADAGLTAESAMERISALEEFYRRSHQGVLAYAARNELPGFMNRNGSGAAEVIGLDYNHGQNVAWSPAERKFVIFDW